MPALFMTSLIQTAGRKMSGGRRWRSGGRNTKNEEKILEQGEGTLRMKGKY